MVDLIHIGVDGARPCSRPNGKFTVAQLGKRKGIRFDVYFKPDAFEDFFRIFEHLPCRVVVRLARDGKGELLQSARTAGAAEHLPLLDRIAVFVKHIRNRLRRSLVGNFLRLAGMIEGIVDAAVCRFERRCTLRIRPGCQRHRAVDEFAETAVVIAVGDDGRIHRHDDGAAQPYVGDFTCIDTHIAVAVGHDTGKG